jgi:O-antigen/teichoic acid export membrane protein
MRSIPERLIGAVCARVPIARKLLGSGDGGLALSAALVFGIRIGGAGLAYVMAFALVRLLGPRDFGIYTHIVAAASLVALVLPLGLNGAVLRFIPEYRTRHSHSDLLGVIGLSRLVVTVAATAIAAIMAALLVSFPGVVPEPYFLPVLLAIASLPLLSVLDLYESFARGFGWTGLAYIPPFIIHPLGILACLGAVWALGGGASAAWGLAAFLGGTAASLIALAVAFHKRLRAELPVVLPRWQSRVWMSAALPLLVVESARAAIEQMDLLLLGVLAGPEEVAAYFAAARTAGLLGFISFAAAALAVSRYSELFAAKQMDALQRAIRTTIHLAFWPTLAGLMALMLLGPFVLRLFDEALRTRTPRCCCSPPDF